MITHVGTQTIETERLILRRFSSVRILMNNHNGRLSDFPPLNFQ